MTKLLKVANLYSKASFDFKHCAGVIAFDHKDKPAIGNKVGVSNVFLLAMLHETCIQLRLILGEILCKRL